HNIGQQAMLLLFFLGVLAFILARERIAGTVLIPYLVFAYMAFVARRNFGPFALVAAVGMSRYFWLALQHVWGDLERRFPSLAAGLDEFIRKSQRKGLSAPARKAVNLLLVGGFAAFGIVKCYAVTSPIIMNAYLPQTFPVLAVDWIHRNQPPGRLFNSYDWGGYLIWSAPDYPVFVDGRTDLFTDKVISEWMQVVNAEPGWQEVLTRWNVHLVLLEPSRPVTKVLASQGWREVYRDPLAVVFEK
ncbi:MAG TPA: hypothetical protein VF813_04060, partial [Anaerolineaceae bacterium]